MLKWNSVVFPRSTSWQPSIKSKEKKKILFQKKISHCPGDDEYTVDVASPQKLYLLQQFFMAVSLSYLLTRPAKMLVYQNF